MTALVLVALVWYGIGLWGYIYWSIRADDGLSLSELLLGLFPSVLGPLTWLIGWSVYGRPIWIYRRKERKGKGKSDSRLVNQ